MPKEGKHKWSEAAPRWFGPFQASRAESGFHRDLGIEQARHWASCLGRIGGGLKLQPFASGNASVHIVVAPNEHGRRGHRPMVVA